MRRTMLLLPFLLVVGTPGAWGQPAIDAGSAGQPAVVMDAGIAADSGAAAAAAEETPPPQTEPDPDEAAAADSEADGEDFIPVPAEPMVEAHLLGEMPAEEDEVQGTCQTPRQAWLQLLWWWNRDPKKAAICFDTSRLDKPAKEAPILAVRLAEYLNSQGMAIDTENAPIDPNYLDPEAERPFYRAPAAPKFVIVKTRDGRWLLSAASLARIPKPGFAKRMADKLPPWFRSEFLGLEVWQLLGVLVLIFLALTVQKTTVFVIRTYLKSWVQASRIGLLNKAVSRADRPIGGLVMAAVFYLGFPALLFPLRISQIAMLATQALAAYSFVWLAYRLIDIFAEWLAVKAEGTDTKLDDQLIPLVAKTLKVFVSVIGGIFVLQNLDVDVSSLLAGLGLGGLAFALAAKDTVANFFGSVMIFIDKPFQIGDWIVAGEVEGTVEEVGFRTTRVRTFYNSLVTLPNANIVNTHVDNYGMRTYRRYSTKLGLCYDTPPDKVQAFCEGVRSIVAGLDGMRKDFYLVEFTEYGASSLQIMVYTFIVAPDWGAELKTRSRLNLAILELADELGVSFAFPTQTLHIDSMVEPGKARPSHKGPTEPDKLKDIIVRRGPHGEGLRSMELTEGYYPGQEWSRLERERKQ